MDLSVNLPGSIRGAVCKPGSSRTFCLGLHLIWPELNLGFTSLDQGLGTPRLFYFIFWRPEGPLWAPRSVGPYGLGRAPSPLMEHLKVLHMAALWAAIIRHDFLSWSHVHSPSARYRLQCTTFGGAYVHPKGAHYKSRSLYVCACARGTCRNFGQNSRSLGQNYRHLFLAKLTVTLRGPQCPAGIWVPHKGAPMWYPEGAPLSKRELI